MKSCNCLNPHIILNPLVPDLISKYKHYRMKNKDYYAYIPRMFNFPYFKFSAKKNGVTLDSINDFVVIDDTTGEFFNIYMSVPCGKCDLCKNAKVNSFVHRCKLESQLYDSLPWFCTLTYDQDHVPKDGVSVREVQLFLKRFRQNLVRHGYADHIRYVFVGEYGKNTHRPHYHCLIWNINSKTSHQYNEVSYLLDKSWNKGFILHRLVDLSNDRCFYYTAKYLRKDNFVPEGCNNGFCTSSRKPGGIGSGFIDKIADGLRKSLNTNFMILNKWSGSLFTLQISRYVLNRIFPTFSRSVPKAFRDALRDFVQTLNYVKNRWFDTYAERKYSKFLRQYDALYSRDFYLGDYDSSNAIGSYYTQRIKADGSGGYCYNDCLYFLRSFTRTIASYMPRFPDFSVPVYLEKRRNLFLGKLFLHQHVPDLSAKAAQVRRSFQLASAREIL